MYFIFVLKNLKFLKQKIIKFLTKKKKKFFSYVWKWTVCLVWIMLKRSRILNLCHVIKLLVRGIWVLINCECTTSESWYYSNLYVLLFLLTNCAIAFVTAINSLLHLLCWENKRHCVSITTVGSGSTCLLIEYRIRAKANFVLLISCSRGMKILK